MTLVRRVALLGAFASVLAGYSGASRACASCGCTLTADWLSQGLSAQHGTTLWGFCLVELPLYNRVNGFQLVPKAKLSLGLLYHL
jgi:hypothetical protein